MEEQSPSLQELVGAARRRALLIAAVGAAVLAVGVPAAFLWPSIYRSTAPGRRCRASAAGACWPT